ncbi:MULTISPECIES: hypothetical protein [Rosenbergiella]|uniref:hypothetical protein n=1 Tax=Rosenbergiella TaxID=1356488 RepID=UPI001F4F3086|nr:MULTISPECIES: hypothetical protein [Rosenbergiella]
MSRPIRTLPKKDPTGKARMTTKEFAIVLGVPELELGQAYATSGNYQGLKLPESVFKNSRRTRSLAWNECIDFAELFFSTFNKPQ